MPQAFICYANEDEIFADLVKMKLREAGIDVWLDHDALRGGDEWRSTIDEGISGSEVVIVVLTPRSCESAYVTYEWAFGLGKGKKVIPLLLDDAEIHPRLKVLHFLDFRDQRVGPWKELVQVVGGGRPTADAAPAPGPEGASDEHAVAKKRILEYLERKGLTMVSFEGIRRYIDPQYDDDYLYEVIRRHHEQLRVAELEGGRPGVGRK